MTVPYQGQDLIINRPTSSNVFDQIPNQWSQQPFVDIQVYDRNQTCPEGTENVFVRHFFGSIPACNCNFDYIPAEQQDILEFTLGEYCKESGQEDCTNVMPIPPMMMKTVGDKQICGRRGGVPFADVVRPDQDGVCPTGTTPCNKNSSPENMICKHSGEECPLTTAYILPTEEISMIPPGRKKHALSEEYYVVYGKTSDAKPVMEMQLIPSQDSYKQFQKTCIRQDQQPISIVNHLQVGGDVQTLTWFYDEDLNYNKWRCEIDLATGLNIDTRYTISPNLFTELEHMKMNKLYSAVEQLPYIFMKFPDMVDAPPGFSRYENQMVTAVRNTIDYKLACENFNWSDSGTAGQNSRQSLSEVLIANSVPEENPLVNMTFKPATDCLIIWGILTFCQCWVIVNKYKTRRFIILESIKRLFVFCFMISMIVQFTEYKEKTEDQIAKYENFDSLLSGGLSICVDTTLSSADTEGTLEVLDGKVQKLNQASIVLIVLVCYIIVESILMLNWHRRTTYKVMRRREIASLAFFTECDKKELQRVQTLKKQELVRQKTDRHRLSHIKKYWDDSFDTDSSMGNASIAKSVVQDEEDRTPLKTNQRQYRQEEQDNEIIQVELDDYDNANSARNNEFEGTAAKLLLATNIEESKKPDESIKINLESDPNSGSMTFDRKSSQLNSNNTTRKNATNTQQIQNKQVITISENESFQEDDSDEEPQPSSKHPTSKNTAYMMRMQEDNNNLKKQMISSEEDLESQQSSARRPEATNNEPSEFIQSQARSSRQGTSKNTAYLQRAQEDNGNLKKLVITSEADDSESGSYQVSMQQQQEEEKILEESKNSSFEQEPEASIRQSSTSKRQQQQLQEGNNTLKKEAIITESSQGTDRDDDQVNVDESVQQTMQKYQRDDTFQVNNEQSNTSDQDARSFLTSKSNATENSRSRMSKSNTIKLTAKNELTVTEESQSQYSSARKDESQR